MNRKIRLSISGLIAFIIWGFCGFFALPVHISSILWFALGLPVALALIIYVAHHEKDK
jgi:hypothetical protein